MSAFCSVLIAIIWLLHLDEYHWPEYCMVVNGNQAHDFMVDDVACKIKWSFFMQPLILSALCYLILVGPVALVGFLLKIFNNKNATIHS